MPCANHGTGCGCFGNFSRGRRSESSQSSVPSETVRSSNIELVWVNPSGTTRSVEPVENDQGTRSFQAARPARKPRVAQEAARGSRRSRAARVTPEAAEAAAVRAQPTSRSHTTGPTRRVQLSANEPGVPGDRGMPRTPPSSRAPSITVPGESEQAFMRRTMDSVDSQLLAGSARWAEPLPATGSNSGLLGPAASRRLVDQNARERLENREGALNCMRAPVSNSGQSGRNFDFWIQITEARCFISQRAPGNNSASMKAFCKTLVHQFNQQAREARREEQFDSMSDRVRASVPRTGLNKQWHLNEDSPTPPSYSNPVPMTFSSPGYEPKPGLESTWRVKLEHGWKYLEKSYVIDNQGPGHTHIDAVSRQLRWIDYKKILQAIIHFEPVTSTFFAPSRANSTPKRNFADNLAFQTKSPAEAIQAIEQEYETTATVGEPYLRQLKDLFEAQGHGTYAWGILIADSYALAFGIRWIIPAVIGSTIQLTTWTNFLAEFMQASVNCESQDRLLSYPPTIEGLQQFVSGPGPHVARRPISEAMYAPLQRGARSDAPQILGRQLGR